MYCGDHLSVRNQDLKTCSALIPSYSGGTNLVWRERKRRRKDKAQITLTFAYVKSDWSNLLWMFAEMSGCDQCRGMWRNWPRGTGLSLGAAAALGAQWLLPVGERCHGVSVQGWLQQLPGSGLALPADSQVIWVNVFEEFSDFTSLTKCLVYNDFMPNIYYFFYSFCYIGIFLLCSGWQNSFLLWPI